MKIRTVAALVAAVATLATGTAAADIIEPCKVSDLSGAEACYGIVSGNIEVDNPEKNYADLIPSSAFGGAFGDASTWSLLAYDSEEDGSDGNFLAGGTWSLDLSPGIDELIIVLKQANGWGAWYFNPAQESGTWKTSWQGKGKGYSHGFALGRGVPVPEPATLGLLGLGLLGIGMARRRARA